MEQEPKSAPTKKKRRWSRILLRTAAILVGVLALFMLIVFATDRIAGRIEASKIEPYGQKVSVDGKKVNLLIRGNGPETVVLLPGYGTAVPARDFELLLREMENDYRVIAVEPLGYGLSDETDKERTTANIVEEIHEAVHQVGADRYVLMGHSIAGLYGVEYVQKYRDEVIAFAGIDTSVVNQPGMDAELPTGFLNFMKQSGLLRLTLKLNGDPYAAMGYDEQMSKQIRMITYKVSNNPTMLNEMSHIADNFRMAQESHAKFPADLPLILFVNEDDDALPNWVKLHEDQVKQAKQGKMILMHGGHYLHHKNSPEIAADFKAFMTEIGSQP
ncbi:alpha/beta hydrolase [Saccharibacillus sp. O16]|nr:alpha/beta hydrolase [Saccharibacillus sp. O16]